MDGENEWDLKLCQLCAISKSDAGTGGNKKGRPAGGNGKATASKGAGPAAKRPASSSSSTSSSTDSDGSQEADAVKAPAAKAAKRKVLRKAKPEGGENAEDEAGGGEEYISRKRERTAKESVVAELLCRWWFALPDWPPNDDAYYDAELKKRGCRAVSIDDWEWVPEIDAHGFRKVYALSQFRGCYRSHSGELIDVRPKDTCPCFNNFNAKPLKELYGLLVKAYEGQMKELAKAEGPGTPLEQELKARLNQARKKLQEVRDI
mmetsp:Transcript_13105/g.24114  ORF Transcript_13105/g.24114 Transcript_13105/m.24114 type:complete len:262 (+) Transcript_13105:85-870(+)